MIQKNFALTIPDISDDTTLGSALTEVKAKLEDIVEQIRSDQNYEAAQSVYMRLTTVKMPTKPTQKIIDFLKNGLPKATIAGMSMSTFGMTDDTPLSLKISVIYFKNSDVTLIEYEGCPFCYRTVGKVYGEKIAKIPDVKGVEIVCAGVNIDIAAFIENVSRENSTVPFFGAVAGSFSMDEIQKPVQNLLDIPSGERCQFAIGQKIHQVGIVLIVFSGKDLRVRADYILGWKPLGKELAITKAESPTCISSLDDMPATQIYRHYLKVEPDANFLLNVCEFPLTIERNGCLMARVPPVYDEDGRLYFNGDFRKDEKVRLGYANSQEMLEGTYRQAESMRIFGPESLLLVICGNRDYFLKKEAHKEVDAYRAFRPDLTIGKGEAEIYRLREQGGVLNSALVAVGMREGSRSAELKAEGERIAKESVDAAGSIPLSTRMAAFLEATTKELKEAAVEAKQASRAKSQFLSNMSHEIRTPINAILGMDEMILRESQDPTIREYAGNILSASNSLLGLVNDILDFSKIEAGKMDIIPVEYALSSVLNDLVNMVQTRAGKKGLDFVVKADPNLPGVLYGDEIRLKQIVTNILTNAVKYTEKGGITLEVTFSRKDNDSVYLIVKVSDTGIGIKEEDIAKLFSAFERIEEKRNRTIEGTGLGMSITQNLLKLMDSRLEVESVYGEGSTFSFKLEQRVVNWEAIGDFEETYKRSLANHKAYHEKFTAPEARILVVDDTVMNLTVVKGLLKQTKVGIDTAESGYEALKKCAGTRYDLIFLDHRMPGMDGIETLKQLKSMTDNPNLETPIISLTANAVSGARAEYMAAGFNDYLTKPIHSDKLETMMIKYLPQDKIKISEENPADEVEDDLSTEAEFLPAWITKLDFLDAAAGLKFCGSAEGYLDALIIFADAAEAGIDEIESYFANRALADYTIKVHALKSSARIIGAMELSEKAKRMEDAGNSGYWEEIVADTPALLALYRSCAAALKPLLKTSDSAERPKISGEELDEAYDSMRDMAASFDYDSLNFILRDLSEYELPPEEKERYKKLKAAAAKPNWEAVNELLKK